MVKVRDMTQTTLFNGNIVKFDKKAKDWMYEDGEVAEADDPRKCPKCQQLPTGEGHDACLGTLPGVKYACCGHGNQNYAYILYENGKLVDGLLALKTMELLKKKRDEGDTMTKVV